MLLYKTRCPKCAEEGRDKRGDNLAVYENGAYCFSCGYYVGNKVLFNPIKQVNKKEVVLPEDITTNLASIATYWLDQYEITPEEIKQNNLLWSSSKQYLIFPIFIENNLEAWLGRYFGDKNEHPKWIAYGICNSLYYWLPNRMAPHTFICLVEDIVSAIKVSRFINCMPLFNAHISKQRLAKLQELGYTDLFIWLDPDKRKESLQYADWANLYGFRTKVIFSDKDPKECNESFILNQVSIQS